jgi:hypothetical protein
MASATAVNSNSNSIIHQSRAGRLRVAIVAFATTVGLSSCELANRVDCDRRSTHETCFRYPTIDQLRFTKGSLEEMTKYLFASKQVPHWFCSVCGSGALEGGVRGPWNKFGVNIRCVPDGIDWSKLTYKDEDGANEL